MFPNHATIIIKECAKELGFDLVTITSAERFTSDEAITLERMGRGLMDGLPWFTTSRVSRGCSPEDLLTGARSIVSLGISYKPEREPDSPHEGDLRGKVAVYAWGDDYHQVIKQKMKTLVETVSAKLDRSIQSRWYVDDGPMLDRAAAHRAGTGWFGKNTNILTSQYGSWVFLGQIVTDLDLTPDSPLKKTCGECTRCLDACPTNAFVGPYVLDARRCISYLTIELKSAIPEELRPLIGNRVFGCDDCQIVCPPCD